MDSIWADIMDHRCIIESSVVATLCGSFQNRCLYGVSSWYLEAPYPCKSKLRVSVQTRSGGHSLFRYGLLGLPHVVSSVLKCNSVSLASNHGNGGQAAKVVYETWTHAFGLKHAGPSSKFLQSSGRETVLAPLGSTWCGPRLSSDVDSPRA